MFVTVWGTAITILENEFKNNTLYKTYSKGFVHKAITINTPHNGTPIADAISQTVPFITSQEHFFGKLSLDVGTYFNTDFFHPSGNSFQASDAVKSLRVLGDVALKKTDVKNHLISGNVAITNLNNEHLPIELNVVVDFAGYLCEVLRDHTIGNDHVALNNICRGYSSYGDKGFHFLQWYSGRLGFEDYFGQGDVIVPLRSQRASLGYPNSGTVNYFNTHNINANHIYIKGEERKDVGTHVLDLLNQSISSPTFNSYIPATVLPNIQPIDTSSQPISNNINNLKIKIESVSKNSFRLSNTDTVLVGDPLKIIFSINDTAHLIYSKVSFQSQNYSDTSLTNSLEANFTIDSTFIGKQKISVTGIYDYTDSVKYYTDTAYIIVKPLSALTGIAITPGEYSLQKDEWIYPKVKAVYSNYITDIVNTDPDLTIKTLDSTLVKYNQNFRAFTALKDTGSTHAVINYKGFKDTISFVVVPALYSGCTNRTTANATLKRAVNWERGVVPATCDSVVVMPGHTLVIDSPVQIRALYIAAGATVSLADSTIKLQIGEADDGNKSFINNGSLIINKGRITVNGSLQLMPGSNFTMTGGELILDGNTGFNETSLSNGANIFDVSNSVNSFSFTGGTLQIIDPPLWNSSQAINCPYNFGDNTTLLFGNGISTTASSNPNGFGGNLMPAKIGKLIIDAASATSNRLFINLNPITVKSAIQVKSGNLVQKALINVIQ